MLKGLYHCNMLAAMPQASPVHGENSALITMLAMVGEFDDEGGDARKIDFLKHRYAGFGRKESAILAGVSGLTAKKWIKDDPRVAKYDDIITTGGRKEIRKEVLQEEWFRNFYLILRRDEYILKKVHGLLDEPFLEVTTDGKRTMKRGSPMMRKEDWDYYSQMRKMYTPESWASIEKAISGNSGQFDINQFILNLQVNNNATP